ncbi:hypothetical protein BJP34_35345 [Moorena producens PAL-8-15-08-1]|uniref:Uncharacterized protein n=1 Tax=Moorena producens PAL-8-15-08-1 TaxID=1458985 RepID=A0A1D8U2C9_9CYAN|nr:hypothetical protein BJP34_35345 [Moorena producens PAL-8-15-08-1]
MDWGIREELTPQNPNCPFDTGESPVLEETSDFLSGHTEEEATYQSEAGSRAQSERKTDVSHWRALERRHG